LKRLYKLLLPLSIITVTTVTSQAATKTAKHTIKNGETLYTIAHANHTTIEEVRKANGLKKGDNLKIGRVLTVPQDTYVANITKKKVLKVTKKPSNKKLAKKNKRAHVASSKKRKRLHVSSSKHLSRQEKKLARTLKSVKFKKINSRKSSKFAISDILFSGKGSKKSMKMIKLAKNKLGRRYVWGAVGQKNTFDCSGLTSYVCKKNGIKIPRRAIEQSKYGKYVSRSHLKPGDLIFFDTSKKRKGYVNHVGIYIGHNKFIHASSAKKKVIITSLSKPFYSQRFKVARRVASL